MVATTPRLNLPTLLSNPLILSKVLCHLDLPELAALTFTSRSLASLILHTPGTHRTVTVPASHPARNLRALFGLPCFARDTQILRLEGRDVLNLQELATCLLTLPHRIRILSLVGCTITFPALSQFLLTLLRNLPHDSSLKGIYLFSKVPTSKANPKCPPSSILAQRYVNLENPLWPEIFSLARERGVVFDAEMCASQLHDPNWRFAVTERLAGVYIGKSCAGCGVTGSEGKVLKMPVPLESADTTAACTSPHLREIEGRGRKQPKGSYRCGVCCEGRVCTRCDKWWCESCLPGFREVQLLRRAPMGCSNAANAALREARGVWMGCAQCEGLCGECLSQTRERCGRCRVEFCAVHEKRMGATKGGAREFKAQSFGRTECGEGDLCHGCWRGLQHNPRRMMIARLAH